MFHALAFCHLCYHYHRHFHLADLVDLSLDSLLAGLTLHLLLEVVVVDHCCLIGHPHYYLLLHYLVAVIAVVSLS